MDPPASEAKMGEVVPGSNVNSEFATADQTSWSGSCVKKIKQQSIERQSLVSAEDEAEDTDGIVTKETQLDIPQVRDACFPDSKAMKEKLRENMHKPRYDVCDFYKTEGVFQAVARNQLFENITLGVISFNALWISIDTEYNSADTLVTALPVFVVAENIFCIFFTFELFMRFGAFAKKQNCLRDAWFCFDAFMVTMMIFETWILTIILLASGAEGGLGNTGLLSLLRLLRLSRLARMARLLRSMPELLILIRGMVAAVRSVLVTMTLLIIVLYVFAILFKSLAIETDFGKQYFPTIPRAMHTLFVFGVIMDNLADFSKALVQTTGDIGIVLLIAWYAFILIATLTVMNLLVGVLCEVISSVAIVEREEIMIGYVNQKLSEILVDFGLDRNEDGVPIVGKIDFLEIFQARDTALLLNEIEVDVFALVDLVDTIFAKEDGTEKKMEFPDLIEVMMDHRSSKSATVKNVTEIRKYCHVRMDYIQAKINEIWAKEIEARIILEAYISTLGEMLDEAIGALNPNPVSFEEQVAIVEGKLQREAAAAQEE
jgi:hypothetical protein|eukprot:TRINITY_DN74131_c0_g1_i1.p1 TRINITY_DN74131_c0_g1~~TRINITY_DN74131_c0_g1_i1.p1  ORF type:complete len:545 (+),score=126.99 TRINITY_DN74131_c0_g1_i1:82-1716(+)